MKCLTITLDDKELFAGEVAEFSWTENAQQITVQARFSSAPGFLDQLKAAAAQRQAQQTVGGVPQQPPGGGSAPGSNEPPARPTLDVVRDDEE